MVHELKKSVSIKFCMIDKHVSGSHAQKLHTMTNNLTWDLFPIIFSICYSFTRNNATKKGEKVRYTSKKKFVSFSWNNVIVSKRGSQVRCENISFRNYIYFNFRRSMHRRNTKLFLLTKRISGFWILISALHNKTIVLRSRGNHIMLFTLNLSEI